MKTPSSKSSKIARAIIAIVISFLYLAGILTGNIAFLETVWVFALVLLSVLMLVIGLTAGIMVVRSLFVVAAELSLLIFLTQTYCTIPASSRLAENNSAMTSLFTVALIYIIYLFGHSLWKALKENYKKIEHEPNSWEKWTTIAAFLGAIFLFLWELYLVINPIAVNLCVYK